MAGRGRPKKVIETNVSEVEHNAKIRAEEQARKAGNPIVDEWVTLDGEKFLKCQKMANGNVYRTYIGGKYVKKKDADGNTFLISNPKIAEAQKKGTYRHDQG